MRSKRGLSSVVSIILIIVLVLVVLGVIGAIVLNFVQKGSSQFSTSRYTVMVGIVSANVDFDTDIANIRVNRELGMGDLVGLKFIFEDAKSSEVLERRFVGFDELEERTFEINLSSANLSFNLYDLEKVAVAPIILLETGEEIIGNPSEVVSGLNKGLNESEEIIEEDPEQDVCYEDSECGTDYFINGTEYCLDNSVHKYKKVFTCILGFCDENLQDIVTESCTYQCFDGACVEEEVGCAPETIAIDCGVDGFIGSATCSQAGNSVVQDYKYYACVNETCDVAIISQTIEECNASEVCFNAECFIPLECTEHADCDPGEICVEGECVIEVTLSSGIISSIWPFSIGEYFDSSDLLNPEDTSLVGSFVFFPGSIQEGCLKVTEHLMPNVTGAAPYVRLDEEVTNISAGDNFEMWETNYVCGL